MQAVYNWNVRNARTTMFMVDGIERDFYTMDPDQIESIQVLKDGLSTVMLGQRSAAGVINVITKKGDEGKPRFSFTVETGFEKALKLPNKLGAVDFMLWLMKETLMTTRTLINIFIVRSLFRSIVIMKIHICIRMLTGTKRYWIKQLLYIVIILMCPVQRMLSVILSIWIGIARMVF